MSDRRHNEPKLKHPMSKGKKFVLWLLLTPVILVVIVGIIGAIAIGTETPEQKQKRLAETTVQLPKVGDTVSDASFNFVVNSIKCGETHLSTGGLINSYSDAQGQFCRLNLTVTNTGNSANSVSAYDQHVFNTQGQKYDYDSGATATAGGNYFGTELNEDINPGNSITGDIVFDVPVGVTPTKAELHGSSSSKGVSVNLQ